MQQCMWSMWVNVGDWLLNTTYSTLQMHELFKNLSPPLYRVTENLIVLCFTLTENFPVQKKYCAQLSHAYNAADTLLSPSSSVNIFFSPAELSKGRPGCSLWRKETPHSCSHTSIHRSGCRCQTLCGATMRVDRTSLLTSPLNFSHCVFFLCVWLKLRDWTSLTTSINLSSGSLTCGHIPGCAARVFFVLFVLPAVGGLRCSLHESCICWIRCAGVYVLGFREAYRAFSQSSLLSFKVKSCQMHQSPAFCGLKVCKHD